MPITRIHELLADFKNHCRSMGWEISENEDWIKIDDEYHNFLWTQTVHPSTFNKIVSNHKCAIRTHADAKYQIVDVSFIAWLFLQDPPIHLVKTVNDTPTMSLRTAIYNLSSICATNPRCLKANKTKSIVFQEFEKYLQGECGVEIKQF